MSCARNKNRLISSVSLVLGNGSFPPPNGQHRALQRSQSHQPSTAAVAAPSVSNHSVASNQYHQLQQQKFYLNNYTNHQNTSHKPNSEPRAPPAKIARLNSSPATATITSEQQKQLPAPLNFPIQISFAGDGAIDSPAVKIDYSKFTLPATSPSIKIDLSNFNQSVTKPTSSSLDEDYDIWACHVAFYFFNLSLTSLFLLVSTARLEPVFRFLIRIELFLRLKILSAKKQTKQKSKEIKKMFFLKSFSGFNELFKCFGESRLMKVKQEI